VTTAAAFQAKMASRSAARSRSHAPVIASGCFFPGANVIPTLPRPGPYRDLGNPERVCLAGPHWRLAIRF
jgi:hypothetical protein